MKSKIAEVVRLLGVVSSLYPQEPAPVVATTQQWAFEGFTIDSEIESGACSYCTNGGLTSSTSQPYDATFVFYYEDENGSVIADLEVKVLLDNDEVETTSITGVQLTQEAYHTFVFPAGSNWNWNDADSATIEVVVRQ